MLSHGERQRFYCEQLRCVGNGGYGLRVLGSDPVIGQRTDLGSNGLHSLSCAGPSGVLVSGANIWKAKVRGANALAGEIRNANGCSIVNTVFNDTLVLSGNPVDGVVNRGTSVTGCDFGPNKGVIDPATNLPSGTGSDAGYDTFIRVDGLKDVRSATTPSAWIRTGWCSAASAMHAATPG